MQSTSTNEFISFRRQPSGSVVKVAAEVQTDAAESKQEIALKKELDGCKTQLSVAQEELIKLKAELEAQKDAVAALETENAMLKDAFPVRFSNTGTPDKDVEMVDTPEQSSAHGELVSDAPFICETRANRLSRTSHLMTSFFSTFPRLMRTLVSMNLSRRKPPRDGTRNPNPPHSSPLRPRHSSSNVACKTSTARAPLSQPKQTPPRS